ncbi:hypothetical protein PSN01_02898 [Micromonospora saelicesensis]|nr:hypothetical protein PSN01_02898 [Micromonospora saelicesensis]
MARRTWSRCRASASRLPAWARNAVRERSASRASARACSSVTSRTYHAHREPASCRRTPRSRRPWWSASKRSAPLATARARAATEQSARSVPASISGINSAAMALTRVTRPVPSVVSTASASPSSNSRANRSSAGNGVPPGCWVVVTAGRRLASDDVCACCFSTPHRGSLPESKGTDSLRQRRTARGGDQPARASQPAGWATILRTTEPAAPTAAASAPSVDGRTVTGDQAAVSTRAPISARTGGHSQGASAA